MDETFHKTFNQLIEVKKQLETLHKARVNDIIKSSRKIEDGSFPLKHVDASLNEEELKLISKIASSEKKYAYLITNSDQNETKKLFISPSFDAIQFMRKFEGKNIRILSGNKFLVEFSSNVDTAKLISMITNRSKE